MVTKQNVGGRTVPVEFTTIPKKPSNRLTDAVMSAEQRKRALNQKFYIESIVPQSNHIVVYGASGSGKTSIMLSVALEIAKRHQETEVYFIYLDGALAMAASFMEEVERSEVDGRFTLTTELSPDEAMDAIKDVVASHKNPENLVFVLDTLKYFAPNILDKGNNAKLLHSIRQDIVSKGATVITLHHTNKDGVNFAGTAEIEQDSDGLLKIETVDDPENYGMKISTIVEGGRIRWNFESISYRFKRGRPETVEMLDKSIDVAGIKSSIIDRANIEEVKKILQSKPLSKGELVKKMQEHDGIDLKGRDRCAALINRYTGTHWEISATGDHNQTHLVSLIGYKEEAVDWTESA